MKKIYQKKIKFLAAVAFAFLANVAVGQNFKVTYEGAPVADGDVIELPYVCEDWSMPEFDFYQYHFEWNPHLEASTMSGSANLKVTVTSVNETRGFQMCWPNNCFPVNPGTPAVSSGIINTDPVDLSIDKSVDFYEQGQVPTEGGTVNVKFECGSETMQITINALLEDKNGVSETIGDADMETSYYTLEGIKVESPSKGLYLVKKGNKAKLMYKK